MEKVAGIKRLVCYLGTIGISRLGGGSQLGRGSVLGGGVSRRIHFCLVSDLVGDGRHGLDGGFGRVIFGGYVREL